MSQGAKTYIAKKEDLNNHINDTKAHESTIGTLSSLKTTTKTNLVSAINELFQNVSDGKSSIATAITAKGQNATANNTFPELASAVNKIPQTVVKEYYLGDTDVLSGNVPIYGNSKIFMNNEDESAIFRFTSKITGTITINLGLISDSGNAYFNAYVDGSVSSDEMDIVDSNIRRFKFDLNVYEGAVVEIITRGESYGTTIYLSGIEIKASSNAYLTVNEDMLVSQGYPLTLF